METNENRGKNNENKTEERMKNNVKEKKYDMEWKRDERTKDKKGRGDFIRKRKGRKKKRQEQKIKWTKKENGQRKRNKNITRTKEERDKEEEEEVPVLRPHNTNCKKIPCKSESYRSEFSLVSYSPVFLAPPPIILSSPHSSVLPSSSFSLSLSLSPSPYSFPRSSLTFSPSPDPALLSPPVSTPPSPHPTSSFSPPLTHFLLLLPPPPVFTFSGMRAVLSASCPSHEARQVPSLVHT